MKVTLILALCCGCAVISSSMADPGKYATPTRPTPPPARDEKKDYPMKMDYGQKGPMETEPIKDQYKTEAKTGYQQQQQTPETKTEDKTEYGGKGKSKYNDGQKMYTKMEDGPATGKRKMYKRSIDDEKKTDNSDPVMDDVKADMEMDAATRKQIKVVQQVLMNRILNDPYIRYTLITYPVYRRQVIMTRGQSVRKDADDDLDDLMDPFVIDRAAGPPGVAAAAHHAPPPALRDSAEDPRMTILPYPYPSTYPPMYPRRCRRICY